MRLPSLLASSDQAVSQVLPSSVPDPHVFGPPGSGSISQRSGSFYHQAKIVRKTLISTVLWLLFDFLSLENDVNVPSKSTVPVISRKTFFYLVFVASWRSMTKIADPDPLVRAIDPRIRIWIHTKMSWIRNTARSKNERDGMRVLERRPGPAVVFDLMTFGWVGTNAKIPSQLELTVPSSQLKVIGCPFQLPWQNHALPLYPARLGKTRVRVCPLSSGTGVWNFYFLVKKGGFESYSKHEKFKSVN